MSCQSFRNVIMQLQTLSLILTKRDDVNGMSFNMSNPDDTVKDNPFGHGHHDDNIDGASGAMGSASDYILIAMIVAMMLCMAVCCLCLFCRSSNRFTICGFNLEVNDRNASVAADDLSELHEVVPLTPTTVGTYNFSDIENKLRSDPPPPNYSEVASQSMLDRFKRKSKRRVNSNCEDKATMESTSSIKRSEILPRGKSKRSEKRNWSYRSFQRSFSTQAHQLSNSKIDETSREEANLPRDKKLSGIFFKSNRPPLQHSASDCTFSTRPERPMQETIPSYTIHDVKQPLTLPAKVPEIAEHDSLSKEDDMTCNGCSETCSKEVSSDMYDDEVFM